jgi:hypothetical protein
VTEKIVLPTSSIAEFDGWEIGSVSGSTCAFYIRMTDFKSDGVTLVLPANDNTVANAYTSSVYPLSNANTIAENIDLAGISIDSSGYLYLVLPTTTADTLSELYTYLAANPLTVVIECVSYTETEVIDYIQQSDLDMTLVVQSSTLSKESDWDATYCRDLTHIINGLLA